MKTIFISLFFLSSPVFVFSQDLGLSQSIAALQSFMNTHIPDMNSGIMRFQITVYESNLVIETFTYSENDESYTKEFDLKSGQVTLDKFKLSKEEANAYGYSVYWEVSLGTKFLLSNIESKKDAEKLVELLENVQRQL